MKNPSILVIDDEAVNFDVIEALLHKEKYQLHYVPNGKLAIASLDTLTPDLILLDVMMPDMDGIAVCQHLKANPRWKMIPIIMVTALNTKDDLAYCLSAGADDFLSKPVNQVELLARIKSMLRIKAQYDDIQHLSQIQEKTIHLLQSNLQELRGNLQKNFSHELNTPLNSIFGALQLILDSIDTLEKDEIKEFISWALESSYRLDRLTKKFLLYLESELEINRQSQAFEPLCPPRYTIDSHSFFLTNDHQSLLGKLAEGYDRPEDLQWELDSGWVRISEKYLFVMLQELIDNALKFSQADSPITIKSEKHQGAMAISVVDQGRGMTDGQIQKIGPFMQFDRDRYEQQGMGLGLALVRNLVNLNHGNLIISSTPGQGLTITITLPLVVDTEEVLLQALS